MAFSVTDFTAVIASKGLASSNKFEVAIHFPDGQRDKDLELMCDTVSLTGIDVQSTMDLQYGIRREVVYGAPVFQDLTMSFYCTEKMEEKKALDNWQNLMVKTKNPLSGGASPGSFNVGYYDDYTKQSKVVVTKLDVSGAPIYKLEYTEVFPKSVTAIELSHATAAAPLKVSATFKYVYTREIPI